MVDPKKPYGGRSEKRLRDLINESNGTSLIEGIDFEYGTVEVIGDHPRHNTRVELVAKKPGFNNSTITYNRLSIDIIAHLPPDMLGAMFIDSLPFTSHEVIEEINNALGVDLIPEEIENFVFYDKRNKYPVQIKEGASLAWLPSEINVTAVHTVALSSVVTVTQMDGLYPPDFLPQ